jgi:hypothetical protein
MAVLPHEFFGVLPLRFSGISVETEPGRSFGLQSASGAIQFCGTGAEKGDSY